MHDIMLDTPIMQEILREGMEKGIEQGRERASNWDAWRLRDIYSLF